MKTARKFIEFSILYVFIYCLPYMMETNFSIANKDEREFEMYRLQMKIFEIDNLMEIRSFVWVSMIYLVSKLPVFKKPPQFCFTFSLKLSISHHFGVLITLQASI